MLYSQLSLDHENITQEKKLYNLIGASVSKPHLVLSTAACLSICWHVCPSHFNACQNMLEVTYTSFPGFLSGLGMGERFVHVQMHNHTKMDAHKKENENREGDQTRIELDMLPSLQTFDRLCCKEGRA